MTLLNNLICNRFVWRFWHGFPACSMYLRHFLSRSTANIAPNHSFNSLICLMCLIMSLHISIHRSSWPNQLEDPKLRKERRTGMKMNDVTNLCGVLSFPHHLSFSSVVYLISSPILLYFFLGEAIHVNNVLLWAVYFWSQ